MGFYAMHICNFFLQILKLNYIKNELMNLKLKCRKIVIKYSESVNWMMMKELKGFYQNSISNNY